MRKGGLLLVTFTQRFISVALWSVIATVGVGCSVYKSKDRENFAQNGPPLVVGSQKPTANGNGPTATTTCHALTPSALPTLQSWLSERRNFEAFEFDGSHVTIVYDDEEQRKLEVILQNQLKIVYCEIDPQSLPFDAHDSLKVQNWALSLARSLEDQDPIDISF